MRIPIVHLDTYPDALRFKNDLREQFPEKNFQIRKKKSKNKITFSVVERVSNSVHDTPNPSKKRKKNRGTSI